jgi:hypothetical protein
VKTIDLTNDYRINRALAVAAGFLVDGAKAVVTGLAILAIWSRAENLFGVVWRGAAVVALAALAAWIL